MTEISIARQCIITVNQGVGTTPVQLDRLTALIDLYLIFGDAAPNPMRNREF